MGRSIVVSGCEAEINEIINYIAADNVNAAIAFYDRLKTLFQLIAENPTIGRQRSELSEGLRALPFGRYVILYRIWSGDVAIVRIIHSARDIEAIFGEGDGQDE